MKEDRKFKDITLKNLALEIYRLNPWEHITELDSLSVKLKNGREVFFALGGIRPYSKDIACMFSREDYLTFRRFITDPKPDKWETISVFHRINAVFCLYNIEDNDVTPAILMGEEGYYYRDLNSNETEMTIDAFEHLIKILQDFNNGSLNINVKNKEIYVISSDDNIVMKYNNLIKNDFYGYKTEIVNDDDIIKISEMKQKKYILEVDSSYLSILSYDKKSDRYYNRYLVTILNHNNSKLYKYKYLKPHTDKQKSIINMIKKVIKKQGKPYEIMIRNKELETFLCDFCKKTDINLFVAHRLKSSEKIRAKLWQKIL